MGEGGWGGEGGRVKILDFGLARTSSGSDGVDHDLVAGEPPLVGREEASIATPELTQQGTVVGTPAYMAPEQVAAAPLDHRCDLFSLGCVLYTMSTGKEPFMAPDIATILRAVTERTPPPPRKIDSKVPAGLSDLILCLLAKKPEDRPASARAVADTLEKLHLSRRKLWVGPS